MTLRHGVELNTAVLGARHLQDAEMFFAEDERVRIIVDHNDAMFLGKAYQALVGLATCTTTRRHVGIVRPHEFYTAQVHLFQFVEVRLPTVILTQVVVHNLRTKNL